MALQTTVDTLRTRFILPLELLQGVLSEWNVASGRLADLEPFAERLDEPGPFPEAVATTLRAVMFADAVPLTRMELLDLLCLAVGGMNVESSGPDFRRPLRQMLVFINGILLSQQETPREEVAVAEDGQRAAETESGPETDPNFYVLESFDLLAPPAPPVMAATASVEPERAVSGSAWASSPEIRDVPSHDTYPQDMYLHDNYAQDLAPDLAPDLAADLAADVRRDGSAAHLVLAGSSARSAAAVEAEPETVWPVVELDESPATREAAARNTETWDAKTRDTATSDTETRDTATRKKKTWNAESWNTETWAEGEDLDADSRPEPRPGRFLSQQALIACAVVVGFAAGMLVPRYMFRTPRHAGPSGGAAGIQLHTDAAGSPKDQPIRTAAPQPGAPEAAPVSGRDGVGVAGVPAGNVQRPATATAATLPAQAALANLVYAPRPQYPALAQLTHVQGDVSIAILVSPRGSVTATQVIDGQPLLRGAAESAVRQWRFRPFVENGRPAQIQTSVVVDVGPHA